ncbi:uncharacterized protein EI97DRAFT_113680 [Westerdykella ornata]|uniref:Transmembrane protein n=1 Tax=Westerdykella ornata TaxID=318751 RepID=A0A6A6JU87_WESOR|nr:uncharacterized protein EI97DRAFT_113680 [Westerdykella ornata]KAF2280171.1 hypothetical protein EI97DRAFT_113680 [Westerdykella ornata]
MRSEYEHFSWCRYFPGHLMPLFLHAINSLERPMQAHVIARSRSLCNSRLRLLSSPSAQLWWSLSSHLFLWLAHAVILPVLLTRTKTARHDHGCDFVMRLEALRCCFLLVFTGLNSRILWIFRHGARHENRTRDKDRGSESENILVRLPTQYSVT